MSAYHITNDLVIVRLQRQSVKHTEALGNRFHIRWFSKVGAVLPHVLLLVGTVQPSADGIGGDTV